MNPPPSFSSSTTMRSLALTSDNDLVGSGPLAGSESLPWTAARVSSSSFAIVPERIELLPQATRIVFRALRLLAE